MIKMFVLIDFKFSEIFKLGWKNYPTEVSNNPTAFIVLFEKDKWANN